VVTDRDPESDRSDYLDLALREYLAMRTEMNDLLRLELNLIVSALVVVGGALAAMATNITGMDNVGRAFVLQVGATFGLIVYIAAIGIANAFIVIEEFVTTSADEIEHLASAGQRRNLASIQRRIRTWTRSPRGRDRFAWFISYGTTQVVALIALVAVVGLAIGGFIGGEGAVSPLNVLRNLVGLLDAILMGIAVVVLVGSLAYIHRWPEIMGSSDIKIAADATRARGSRPAPGQQEDDRAPES
jgi:uncharacterized membrane protein